ncbi:MAG: alpha/beta hydrolase family protein [Rubrivivax sp.]
MTLKHQHLLAGALVVALSLGLQLANATAASAAHAPKAAVAVPAAEPVTLTTPTGVLHGTLQRPDGAGPHPVALLIAGSGPTDRDGNSAMLPGRNNSLMLLAQALAERGVASVRYDKRGIAASAAAGPREADLSFDTLVDDAARWVQQLAADARFTRVLVAGHSEGALVGTLAAAQSPTAALVLLAGPSEPAATVLRRQLAGRLPPSLADRSEALLKTLEAGRTDPDVPEALNVLYRPSVQPYLVSWFRHDPAQALARLSLPCLIVQGTTDLQVLPDDARRLHAARPGCTLALVDGMNHVLKTVPADPAAQQASYGNPALPLAEGLQQSLTAFLTQPAVTQALRPAAR